jgi:SAM-dependent methyltransferase
MQGGFRFVRIPGLGIMHDDDLEHAVPLPLADEVGEHSRKRPAPPGCGYDDSGREHGYQTYQPHGARLTRPSRLRLDRDRELAELREYLGDRYDDARLRGHSEAVENELRELGDEDALYRTSEAYLYDLTVFAMSETKLPYVQALTRAVPPPAALLDYGCGIGSDGLLLLEAGYDVTFADFDNPSARYLRWRLEHRGLSAPVIDLDAGPVPPGFDAAYAFDVIEHVDDPLDFLHRMEAAARLVMVNLLEPEPGDVAMHHELPIDRLVHHAAQHRLRHFRRYHGRSYLLLYDSAPGPPATRLASRARVRAAGIIPRR